MARQGVLLVNGDCGFGIGFVCLFSIHYTGLWIMVLVLVECRIMIVIQSDITSNTN